MKKVLFSLLLAFAFIPVTFGQSAGNAKEYSMVTKDTTICSSFTLKKIWRFVMPSTRPASS